MFWVTMIMLIVAGLAACLPQWAKSNSGVSGMRDAFRPVEGIIGLAAIGWGVVWIVSLLLNIGSIGAAPLFYIFSLIVGGLLIAVGFALGGKTLAGLLGGGGASKALTARHGQITPQRHSFGSTALITAGLSILLRVFNG